MFQRLDDIRFDGVFQKRCHGAGCIQIIGGYRFAVEIVSYDDPRQSLLQIGQIVCQTEDCHDLRCHRDHKVVFSDHPIHLIAKADNDVAEYAVVHIQASFPHNLPGIDPQGVSLLDVVVQHRGQKIIG